MKKIEKITLIILTKNNDIYNRGIVTIIIIIIIIITFIMRKFHKMFKCA